MGARVIVVAETTIREAVPSDVPRLAEMFSEFVASSQYAKYVGNHPTFASRAIERMIGNPAAAVFVVDAEQGIIGMLGVLTFEQPFSGELIASELFWWLDPNHRGHGCWLLKRAERWARERGAVRMSMMSPVDKPRVASTYMAMGYTEVERVFQRDL